MPSPDINPAGCWRQPGRREEPGLLEGPTGLTEKGQIPGRLSAGHADGPCDRSLSFFSNGYLGLGVDQFWIPGRKNQASELARPPLALHNL